jgi:Na+/proline symporter
VGELFFQQNSHKRGKNQMKKVLFLLLSVLLFVISVTPAVIAAVSQDNSALIDVQAKPEPPANPFE